MCCLKISHAIHKLVCIYNLCITIFILRLFTFSQCFSIFVYIYIYRSFIYSKNASVKDMAHNTHSCICTRVFFINWFGHFFFFLSFFLLWLNILFFLLECTWRWRIVNLCVCVCLLVCVLRWLSPVDVCVCLFLCYTLSRCSMNCGNTDTLKFLIPRRRRDNQALFFDGWWFVGKFELDFWFFMLPASPFRARVVLVVWKPVRIVWVSFRVFFFCFVFNSSFFVCYYLLNIALMLLSGFSWSPKGSILERGPELFCILLIVILKFIA